MSGGQAGSGAGGSGGKLGLWMAGALVVGNMIGSGVFLLPASLGPYGGISLFGWLLAGAGAMLLALVFARLSRLVPRAGGPYAFSRVGFGDFAGFLVAWGYWVSIWAGNAAIAVGFASYMGDLVPALSTTPTAGALTALTAIWVLTGVNAYGVREAGAVQLATTVLKILPLVAVGLAGSFFFFEAGHFSPLNASDASPFGAITATAALTLWAYSGVESATVPAEEVRDPTRTIPRATVLGTIVASAVYILATVGVMGVIPPDVLAASEAPFADAARAMWGEWAGSAVAAGAAISSFGALNGWILLQGRIPFAAARDGLFPTRFGRLSRRGTPAFGLVVSSVLVTLLMSMNYRASLVEQFTFILLLSTMTTLFPYALSAAAEILIYVRAPERFEGRRLAGATVIAALAFAFALWAMAGTGPETVFWGFLLLMGGIPVYVWMAWRYGAGPDSVPEPVPDAGSAGIPEAGGDA